MERELKELVQRTVNREAGAKIRLLEQSPSQLLGLQRFFLNYHKLLWIAF